MRAFLAVVDSGNFARAARTLEVAPSVMSKRIRQLEHELGGDLFVRTTHAVRLTERGERALSLARSITLKYEDLAEAVNDGNGQISGRLRIKIPTLLATRVFDGIIWSFHDRYPQVDLQMVLLDRPVDIDHEGFDVALTIGSLPRDNVYHERLVPFPRIFVAAPSYLQRAGLPRQPRDLEKHVCLFVEQEGASWGFQTRDAPRIRFEPRLSSNSGLMLLSAARQGMGIALLWEGACRPLIESGELIQVLADFPTNDRWITIQATKERADVPRIRAFIDHLRENLRSPADG